MTNQMAKPAYNAKRRIQYLFAFCVFLIVAATAAWYFVAGKIDEGAGNAIAAQGAKGLDIECPNRDVRGYPFRFGLFCDALSFTDRKSAISFRAGGVRSAAQFYDPTKIVAELDGPAILNLADGQMINLSWSLMRATSVIALGEPLPDSFSLVGKQFTLSTNDITLRADQIETHMRVVGTDVDVAGRAEAIVFETSMLGVNQLPPLGVDFNTRLKDAATKIRSENFNPRGLSGVLSRAAVLLNTDSGLLIDGPFAVDDAGLIDAALTLRIIDVDAVTRVVTQSFPQIAPIFTAFTAGQPRSGEKSDEINLEITIAKSNVSLGFIPLGRIPQL
ncbi:MAG: DUF2125 domain-containing protein [Ahrensia sp.]|nr:DUF2125 domain-containing protein [Ahrensia sp.]